MNKLMQKGAYLRIRVFFYEILEEDSYFAELAVLFLEIYVNLWHLNNFFWKYFMQFIMLFTKSSYFGTKNIV